MKFLYKENVIDFFYKLGARPPVQIQPPQPSPNLEGAHSPILIEGKEKPRLIESQILKKSANHKNSGN
ncbi:hypothetical protein AKJ41_03275 [candidate division MSBL1 archaeon SCGC-AAA259O05]|uniref:Uncharacterized protein n=1 Tax=candidate division MSBL1 archaeon SCGC-AAA259O05 TaxID=1698271 RepID=A0A133V3D7_9EURY|nr:hypothetical protein AKJ41_03275 [candidate division MSBL1 archaeon SCGC-AAA259O05]